MNWTQAVRQEIDEVTAVDGKTARGYIDLAAMRPHPTRNYTHVG